MAEVSAAEAGGQEGMLGVGTDSGKLSGLHR